MSQEIKSNGPDGKIYPLRTLRDIFELPSYEHIDRCLTELRKVFLEARAQNDLFKDFISYHNDPIAREEMYFEWPEVLEWNDDGKGQIDLEFSAPDSTLIVSIRSDKSKDNQ